MKNKIKEQYIRYILDNGSEPESVYKFAKKLKITESEFEFESIELEYDSSAHCKSIYQSNLSLVTKNILLKYYS